VRTNRAMEGAVITGHEAAKKKDKNTRVHTEEEVRERWPSVQARRRAAMITRTNTSKVQNFTPPIITADKIIVGHVAGNLFILEKSLFAPPSSRDREALKRIPDPFFKSPSDNRSGTIAFIRAIDDSLFLSNLLGQSAGA